MNRSMVAGALLVCSMIGISGCSVGDNLGTPSGVAKAYLNALEQGDLDRVIDLTESGQLEGLSSAVRIDAPDERISNVEIREETHDEGIPIVAATYELGGQEMSTRITLGQVSIDGKPGYVVTNELPLMKLDSSSPENWPFAVNGEQVDSGVALVLPGSYDLERDLGTEFVESSVCEGTARVILDNEGSYSSETESQDGCLTTPLWELSPSGESAAKGEVEIRAAIGDLVLQCSEACRAEGWEAASKSELGTLPEDCEVFESNAVLCMSSDANSVESVNLVRLSGGGDLSVELSIEADGALKFSAASVKHEYCEFSCERSESWRSEGLFSNGPVSSLSGTYRDGTVVFSK